ncbi:MAG: TIGR03960 family B12-binding radical SAM protein [Candidatus Omnitrophica bacterium]|jgi:radical SAM family uncharacterized protein|nr:TIGR03960 family B12-binding radical SAM protein [Candidatus Omnitrophota bacterium]
MDRSIFFSIQKPFTYLGNEINSTHKEFSKQKVKIALGYPDIYEIGMSNLGIRILYGLINNIGDVVCERFFSPLPDMAEVMRQKDIPLFTLESREPLMNFDIIGFSVSSELNYTNILEILSLSKIPIFSSERNNQHPLIIAGGDGSFSPESLSEFIDVWIIGEGEEIMPEVIDLYKNLKGFPRYKILEGISTIKGIYIPSFYKEDKNSRIFPVSEKFPTVIERRTVKDFENSFFPVKWITPVSEITHDRISLEIMRGCPNNCFFCQGGFCWKPVRKRSVGRIIDLAQQTYKNTGYEEISLLSFSSGDHPDIEKIIENLLELFPKEKVAISFPSLRIDSFSFSLANKFSNIKRTGLTFAPETGEKLRKFIGKAIDDEKLISLACDAKKNHWRQIKLYFILGLPGETEQTIEEIVILIEKLSKIISIKASFSIFIPKPHTPFQWEKFPIREDIFSKRKYLLDKFSKNRYVKLNFHSYDMSLIETILSRGNRSLGNAIKYVWENGGKMENWKEFFVFERWEDAFEKTPFDKEICLGPVSPDKNLPWQHIKSYFSKDYLWEKRNSFYSNLM